MDITHFIVGAHMCLINEFPHMKAKPFECFLKWQCHNVPDFVEKNKNLHKAMEKMEFRDNKRAIEVPSSAPRPFLKQSRRQVVEGPTTRSMRGYVEPIFIRFLLDREVQWKKQSKYIYIYIFHV